MVYALIYPENADIVGTDRSPEEARSELAQCIGKPPSFERRSVFAHTSKASPVADFIPADQTMREPVSHR